MGLRWPKYFIRPQLTASSWSPSTGCTSADPLIILLAKPVFFKSPGKNLKCCCSHLHLRGNLECSSSRQGVCKFRGSVNACNTGYSIFRLEALALRENYVRILPSLFSKLSVFCVLRYLTTSWPHRYRSEAHWSSHTTPWIL